MALTGVQNPVALRHSSNIAFCPAPSLPSLQVPQRQAIRSTKFHVLLPSPRPPPPSFAVAYVYLVAFVLFESIEQAWFIDLP